MRIRITDIRDHTSEEIDLPLDSRDMTGWQSGVAGWSIGPKGSGASIELDEPLRECHVGIFSVSYHVLLWGRTRDLPQVWSFPQDKSRGNLVPFDAAQWLLIDREELGRVAMGGNVRLRFDQSPMRFGNYIFESLAAETSKECCAFCNELLRTYFRVGSQQVCPACTEKFKQGMEDNLARFYRRALGAGIIASIAGGLIAGVLLTSADFSFGSILTGVFVGMAMRIASRESAGTKYRVTAVVLTFLAGSLPWWRGLGTTYAAVYLAVGMFAAWILTSRNAQTRIHGPFQSRTA